MKDSRYQFLLLAGVVVAALVFRFAYDAASPAALSEAAAPASASAAMDSIAAIAGPGNAFAPSSGNAAGSAAGFNAAAATSSGPSMYVRAGDAPAPTFDDAATLVADLTTGTVFEATNPDRRWPTASLAKLMSATIVEDKIDLTTQVSITSQMFAADPSEPVLAVGGTYTTADLLHLMLLPSSNVAAEAVAWFYGHGAFLNEMNARATAWGMTSTYYNDPFGISAADQSTAHDLMLLAQKIYTDYPQILAVTRTPVWTVTDLATGGKTVIRSINDFAGGPTFIGGKTGHTPQAEGNLISIFRYDDYPVLVIVLGTNNRFNDTQELYDWFKANYK